METGPNGGFTDQTYHGTNGVELKTRAPKGQPYFHDRIQHRYTDNGRQLHASIGPPGQFHVAAFHGTNTKPYASGTLNIQKGHVVTVGIVGTGWHKMHITNHVGTTVSKCHVD